MKPTFCQKNTAIDAYLNGDFYVFVEVTNMQKFAIMKFDSSIYLYPSIPRVQDIFDDGDWQLVTGIDDAIEFGLLKRGDT